MPLAKTQYRLKAKAEFCWPLGVSLWQRPADIAMNKQNRPMSKNIPVAFKHTLCLYRSVPNLQARQDQLLSATDLSVLLYTCNLMADKWDPLKKYDMHPCAPYVKATCSRRWTLNDRSLKCHGKEKFKVQMSLQGKMQMETWGLLSTWSQKQFKQSKCN